MQQSPSRFDAHKDLHDSQKPAPTSYNPRDTCSSLNSKKLVHVRAKAPRFHKKEYVKDVPGPGAYRMQSNFGVYCPSDVRNKVNSDLLVKLASEQQRASWNGAYTSRMSMR